MVCCGQVFGLNGLHSLRGHQLPVQPTLSDRLTGEFKLR
jgi:hypothetical protein